MIRAVIDANVLISGLISKHGAPREILHAWRQQEFELLTSLQIIGEVIRVLRYPRIQATYQLTESDIKTVRDSLLNDALVLDDNIEIRRSRDQDDDKFLGCAIEGHADYPVSGDRHLMEIKYIYGTQIVTATQFIAVLKRRSEA